VRATLTELAKDADLLVTETSSFEERMKNHLHRRSPLVE
jgi:hypothetical protein